MAEQPLAADALTVRQILGVPVHAVTMAQVCTICEQAVDCGRQMRIGIANAFKVVKIRDDVRLREAIATSDLVLADGASLVWAGWILRQPLPERVTGIDLFFKLLALADRRGYSVYFLGATPDVVGRVVQKVAVDYPNVRVAGFRDGYFSDDACAAIAETIRSTDPDFLFLGMGTPKKELFLFHWSRASGARIAHGVGGTFDVYAGKVRRAPRWMQFAGLEWFHRVLQEPRRMWKRYLVTNTLFLMLLLKAMFGGLRGAACFTPHRESLTSPLAPTRSVVRDDTLHPVVVRAPAREPMPRPDLGFAGQPVGNHLDVRQELPGGPVRQRRLVGRRPA